MSKHTPGPWFLSPNGRSINTAPGRDGFCVAEISDANIHFDDFPEEYRANAALIAAAPETAAERDRLREVNAELLAALKELYRLHKKITDQVSCDHSVGICWCDDYAALDQAAAVIAKAKGE